MFFHILTALTYRRVTYEYDFNGPDDVHGCGQCDTGIEEHTDSSSALGTQRPGYQEVRSTSRHNAVRGYGTHRNSSQHCLKK